MELIRISPHVIFRNYEDITVLYNLVYKNYAVINSIGNDIFNIILNRDGADLDIITEWIANEYCVNSSDILEDIIRFIDSLFHQNMISICGKFDEQTVPDILLPSENDVEGDIIQFLQNKHQIYSATFELTYACNEKCIHCYASYPASAQDKLNLTLEKCKSLIDELRQMNCFHLIFTGGDPFVFDGFLDLLEYARHKQFSFDIYTNGQAIANNPSLVSKIKDFYPRTFYISLYGATAETHDAITQIRGSFEKTICAIKLLKNADISVVLNVMIMKPNYMETQKIIKLAGQLNIEYRIGLSLIRKNNGSDAPLEYFIDDEAIIEDVIRNADGNVFSMDAGALSSQSGLLCGAGTTSLCVSPNGDVYPCVSLKKKLGSVFSESLSDIWGKPSKKEYVYSLTWENTKKCADCKFNNLCPHCIGISEAECGDEFDCNYCDRLVAQSRYRIASESGMKE